MSDALGGIGSVPRSAFPFFEKTSATSGKDFSASSMRSCICVDWSIDAEGTRKLVTVMSFSSSCGMNSSPRKPNASTAARKTPTPDATKGCGRATAFFRSGSYFSLNQRIGLTSVSLTLPLITMAIIAGMKVSERTKAAASASIRVIAIGAKVLPSTPWKVSSGTKTRKMMS